ncbi:hypothetical protein L1887_12850 [Cichorium endivia]|nr:hypothetical protein L1887_12850 [Cichorium endivia]
MISRPNVPHENVENNDDVRSSVVDPSHHTMDLSTDGLVDGMMVEDGSSEGSDEDDNDSAAVAGIDRDEGDDKCGSGREEGGHGIHISNYDATAGVRCAKFSASSVVRENIQTVESDISAIGFVSQDL